MVIINYIISIIKELEAQCFNWITFCAMEVLQGWTTLRKITGRTSDDNNNACHWSKGPPITACSSWLEQCNKFNNRVNNNCFETLKDSLKNYRNRILHSFNETIKIWKYLLHICNFFIELKKWIFFMFQIMKVDDIVCTRVYKVQE